MALTFKIIITLTGLLGLYQLFRVKDFIVRIILVLQVISIGIALIPPSPLVKLIFEHSPKRDIDYAVSQRITQDILGLGLWFFIIAAALVIIYALTKRGFTPLKRLLLIFASLPVLLVPLFGKYHWPYAYQIRWAMAIPVLACILMIVNGIWHYKNELGFLAILGVSAALQLSLKLINP